MFVVRALLCTHWPRNRQESDRQPGSLSLSFLWSEHFFATHWLVLECSWVWCSMGHQLLPATAVMAPPVSLPRPDLSPCSPSPSESFRGWPGSLTLGGLPSHPRQCWHPGPRGLCAWTSAPLPATLQLS